MASSSSSTANANNASSSSSKAKGKGKNRTPVIVMKRTDIDNIESTHSMDPPGTDSLSNSVDRDSQSGGSQGTRTRTRTFSGELSRLKQKAIERQQTQAKQELDWQRKWQWIWEQWQSQVQPAAQSTPQKYKVNWSYNNNIKEQNAKPKTSSTPNVILERKGSGDLSISNNYDKEMYSDQNLSSGGAQQRQTQQIQKSQNQKQQSQRQSPQKQTAAAPTIAPILAENDNNSPANTTNSNTNTNENTTRTTSVADIHKNTLSSSNLQHSNTWDSSKFNISNVDSDAIQRLHEMQQNDPDADCCPILPDRQSDFYDAQQQEADQYNWVQWNVTNANNMLVWSQGQGQQDQEATRGSSRSVVALNALNDQDEDEIEEISQRRTTRVPPWYQQNWQYSQLQTQSKKPQQLPNRTTKDLYEDLESQGLLTQQQRMSKLKNRLDKQNDAWGHDDSEDDNEWEVKDLQVLDATCCQSCCCWWFGFIIGLIVAFPLIWLIPMKTIALQPDGYRTGWWLLTPKSCNQWPLFTPLKDNFVCREQFDQIKTQQERAKQWQNLYVAQKQLTATEYDLVDNLVYTLNLATLKAQNWYTTDRKETVWVTKDGVTTYEYKSWIGDKYTLEQIEAGMLPKSTDVDNVFQYQWDLIDGLQKPLTQIDELHKTFKNQDYYWSSDVATLKAKIASINPPEVKSFENALTVKQLLEYIELLIAGNKWKSDVFLKIKLPKDADYNHSVIIKTYASVATVEEMDATLRKQMDNTPQSLEACQAYVVDNWPDDNESSNAEGSKWVSLTPELLKEYSNQTKTTVSKPLLVDCKPVWTYDVNMKFVMDLGLVTESGSPVLDTAVAEPQTYSFSIDRWQASTNPNILATIRTFTESLYLTNLGQCTVINAASECTQAYGLALSPQLLLCQSNIGNTEERTVSAECTYNLKRNLQLKVVANPNQVPISSATVQLLKGDRLNQKSVLAKIKAAWKPYQTGNTELNFLAQCNIIKIESDPNAGNSEQLAITQFSTVLSERFIINYSSQQQTVGEKSSSNKPVAEQQLFYKDSDTIPISCHPEIAPQDVEVTVQMLQLNQPTNVTSGYQFPIPTVNFTTEKPNWITAPPKNSTGNDVATFRKTNILANSMYPKFGGDSFSAGTFVYLTSPQFDNRCKLAGPSTPQSAVHVGMISDNITNPSVNALDIMNMTLLTANRQFTMECSEFGDTVYITVQNEGTVTTENTNGTPYNFQITVSSLQQAVDLAQPYNPLESGQTIGLPTAADTDWKNQKSILLQQLNNKLSAAGVFDENGNHPGKQVLQIQDCKIVQGQRSGNNSSPDSLNPNTLLDNQPLDAKIMTVQSRDVLTNRKIVVKCDYK